MSAQQTRIEYFGRLQVHQPVKLESGPDEDQIAWAQYHQLRHDEDES